ncbi:MAG: hypothetical protein JWN62_2186 [Acidimicrobiales bacterium]|nr:hypothetical protein [Acidimicrobiales bacterium]
MVALFQRGAYFAPMARLYAELAELGQTVVVAYVGEGDAAPGVTHVRLHEQDALAHEWSVIVLSPVVGAHVIGTDLEELDPEGRTLEGRRRFQATWGFDRLSSTEHARRILSGVRQMIPSEVAARIDAAIASAQTVSTTGAEAALGRAALSLTASIEAISVRLDNAKTRLDRETQHATKDPLTGLMNREGLQRWLSGEAMNGVDMPLVGVVMIDLDGFKAVNDTHGHDVGDVLLQAFADALTRCTRPTDIVIRWGGDEFVVICPGAEGDELVQLATRMVNTVATTSTGNIQIGASAGVQTCRYRPLLMAGADEAMYHAKRAGGGPVFSIGGPPAVRSFPMPSRRVDSRCESSKG